MLACQAVVWLAVAAFALRAFSFKTAMKLAAHPLSGPSRGEASAAVLAADIRWAVLAAARRVPWRTVCIHRGLAAQIMLRRRGAPSRLYYGARSDGLHEDGSHGLAAHVWVRSGDQGVVGGEGADRFAVLAAFPPQSEVEDQGRAA